MAVKTLTVKLNDQTFHLRIFNGHVWLTLGGVETPLAMLHCQDGGRYAYLTAGNTEIRVYDDGSVVG